MVYVVNEDCQGFSAFSLVRFTSFLLSFTGLSVRQFICPFTHRAIHPCSLVTVTVTVGSWGCEMFKAKLYAIYSDTQQLQLIKLHHFKLDRFKSI